MNATLSQTASLRSGRYLYIQTNDIREGQNAVLGYSRASDGSLAPLPGNPFYTAGTGINNDTHGKLGPQDNDTPVVCSQDGKRLFTVIVSALIVLNPDVWKGPICACKCRVRCPDQ